VDNDELRRRYEAANMTVNGLQIRLRRIGVAARRSTDKAHQLNEDQIRSAIRAQGSVAAAARQLDVGRAALAARAQQLGVLPRPADIPADLPQRYQNGDSVRLLASTYGVGPTTITRWLDASGVPRRPRGRQAQDG
jgi:transposase-like protein